jgi:hypothetical protein
MLPADNGPSIFERTTSNFPINITARRSPSKLNIFQQLMLRDSSKITISMYNAALTDSKAPIRKKAVHCELTVLG